MSIQFTDGRLDLTGARNPQPFGPVTTVRQHNRTVDSHNCSEKEAKQGTVRAFGRKPGMTGETARSQKPPTTPEKQPNTRTPSTLINEYGHESVRQVNRTVPEHPNGILDRIRTMIGGEFAGDPAPVLLVYLAFTSRLLDKPLAVGVYGESSVGKSHIVDTALKLIPSEEIIRVNAASPRALIYGDQDLIHRVVVFGEIDSLPDDGPAAEAIRSLISDHRLRYDTVERNDTTGRFETRHIDRPGPTGLITTGVHPPRYQLGTRLLPIDVTEDPARTWGILQHIAKAATGEIRRIDFDQFVEEQRELRAEMEQRGFPLVIIPFAEAIGQRLPPCPGARMKRDFSQILSLLQAHALLHWRDRQWDRSGRLIAMIDDYAAVRPLVAEMFATAAGDGISTTLRNIVEAVGPDEVISIAEIARRTELVKSTISFHVKHAIARGFLENKEQKPGLAARVQRTDVEIEKSSKLPTVSAIRRADQEIRA